MSSRPTLSVYVPNYNHGDLLFESLSAILTQSWLPDEILVIDDCSTDHSEQVLREFIKHFPSIRLARNETNQGVVRSMNKALTMVHGDYVYGAAADDKVLPGFFEKSMSLLSRYPQAGLCCSDIVHLDGKSHQLVAYPNQWSNVSRYFSAAEFAAVLNGNYIAGHTTIAKRTACLEMGGFLSELQWHCDWFLWLAIAFKYGICYVPESLAALRVNAETYSGAGMKNQEAQKEIFLSVMTLLSRKDYEFMKPHALKSKMLKHFSSELRNAVLNDSLHLDKVSQELLVGLFG